MLKTFLNQKLILSYPIPNTILILYSSDIYIINPILFTRYWNAQSSDKRSEKQHNQIRLERKVDQPQKLENRLYIELNCSKLKKTTVDRFRDQGLLTSICAKYLKPFPLSKTCQLSRKSLQFSMLLISFC